MAPFSLDEDGRGVSIAGWRVRATTAPIIGDAAMEAAAKRLGGVLTVPEILFGNSGLELAHGPSGVTLSFSALDALAAWRQEDLPPLKVTVAQQWQAARREEIERQNAVVLAYDWTYTTPYQGTLARGGGGGGGDGAAHEAVAAAADGAAPVPGEGQQQADGHAAGRQAGSEQRVICTSLEGHPQSAEAAAQAHEAAAAAAAAAEGASHGHSGGAHGHAHSHGHGHGHNHAAAAHAAGALPSWVPTQRQADRGLLLSRDEPILFFAEVPLYESELDDNGCSQLVAKVRVMPRCWLMLLRFWLRVDGALVRLRETRLFCRFDQPGSAATVLRETKHFEGTAAQLRAAGAPVAATAYSDGDAAAAVFSAIAPACLSRYELHQLDLMPAA